MDKALYCVWMCNVCITSTNLIANSAKMPILCILQLSDASGRKHVCVRLWVCNVHVQVYVCVCGYVLAVGSRLVVRCIASVHVRECWVWVNSYWKLPIYCVLKWCQWVIVELNCVPESGVRLMQNANTFKCVCKRIAAQKGRDEKRNTIS